MRSRADCCRCCCDSSRGLTRIMRRQGRMEARERTGSEKPLPNTTFSSVPPIASTTSIRSLYSAFPLFLGIAEPIRRAASFPSPGCGGAKADFCLLCEAAQRGGAAAAGRALRGNERTRHPGQLRDRRTLLGVELHPEKAEGDRSASGAVCGCSESKSDADPHVRTLKCRG